MTHTSARNSPAATAFQRNGSGETRLWAIVQFMVLRLQGSQDSRDSETPDTLREHDVTHWQKTVNCWDIARFMWIDHLFIPAMLCQQRCVRKSHTHGKNQTIASQVHKYEGEREKLAHKKLSLS